MRFRKVLASLFVGTVAVAGAVVFSSPAHAADIPGFPGCPDLFRSSIFIPGSASPAGGATSEENVFQSATTATCTYLGVAYFFGTSGKTRVGPHTLRWDRINQRVRQ